MQFSKETTTLLKYLAHAKIERKLLISSMRRLCSARSPDKPVTRDIGSLSIGLFPWTPKDSRAAQAQLRSPLCPTGQPDHISHFESRHLFPSTSGEVVQARVDFKFRHFLPASCRQLEQYPRSTYFTKLMVPRRIYLPPPNPYASFSSSVVLVLQLH
jgi:hypothetical protein